MPAPKDYIKIQYPRKCNHCEYVSNNPQMWHYHKQTHEVISPDQLCDHGCGNPAKYKGTGGIYSCSKVSQRCPEYIKKHSRRVKEHWQRPEAAERKTKATATLLETACTPAAIEKMKKTKKIKSGLLTPDDAKNYRHYARAIRQRAQQWAIEQGYELGQQTFHVDHKFSILDSWKAKLPASIVNHPANLQILEAKLNSSKGSKSSLTLEELMRLIIDSNPSV